MKKHTYKVVMKKGDQAALWFIRNAHPTAYMEHQNQYTCAGNPIYMMSDDEPMNKALMECSGVVSFLCPWVPA